MGGLIVLLSVAELLGWGLVLAAGRREARGDLAGARRTVRRGGLVLLAAAPARLLAVGATLGGAAWAGAALGLAGAFAGLLAGLSGKPRPSGPLGLVLAAAGAAVHLALAGIR